MMVKNNELAFLGYFVWWSMEGVSFDRDQLDQLVADSDLQWDPPKMLPRTAFLEAVRTTKAKAHTHKVLIRNMNKGEVHKFALVDEHLDEKAQKMGYNHSATLTFNQVTEEIWCSQHHRAHDLIKDRFAENCQFINAYELRRWVQKILKGLQNISVRDKGGVYYVDVKYTDILEKLSDLFDKIPGAEFEIIPQVDSEKTKKSIWKAYVTQLKHKIAKFNEAIANDKYQAKGKGWENAISQFKELREEVSFYADRLSFTAKDLDKELEDLTKEVRKKFID